MCMQTGGTYDGAGDAVRKGLHFAFWLKLPNYYDVNANKHPALLQQYHSYTEYRVYI